MNFQGLNTYGTHSVVYSLCIFITRIIAADSTMDNLIKQIDSDVSKMASRVNNRIHDNPDIVVYSAMDMVYKELDKISVKLTELKKKTVWEPGYIGFFLESALGFKMVLNKLKMAKIGCAEIMEALVDFLSVQNLNHKLYFDIKAFYDDVENGRNQGNVLCVTTDKVVFNFSEEVDPERILNYYSSLKATDKRIAIVNQAADVLKSAMASEDRLAKAITDISALVTLLMKKEEVASILKGEAAMDDAMKKLAVEEKELLELKQTLAAEEETRINFEKAGADKESYKAKLELEITNLKANLGNQQRGPGGI